MPIARWQRAVDRGALARGKSEETKTEVEGVVSDATDRFVFVRADGKTHSILRQNLKR